MALSLNSTPGLGNHSQALRFKEDGTFKISVLTDLHLGESQDSVGPENDALTASNMRRLLSAEKPDLAVINGDLITGGAENSTSYVERVVAPLLEHNLSWASAYGNHDSARNLCPDELFELEKRYQNSLTQKMVDGSDAGVTNYYLPVWPYDASAETPEVILWFFDTRGGTDCSTFQRRPNWVDPSVVEWFTRTQSELKEEFNRAIPSLAFFHIPTYAMHAFQQVGVNSSMEPGINDDIPSKSQGSQIGGVTDYSGQDIPFMEALLNTEELKATFSGHDHGNDWCFKWDSKLPRMNLTGNGINMCFARRSGYGGYGHWTQGGRQILLQEQANETTVQTWVRLGNGTTGETLTLNSTYGHDRYIPERESKGCRSFPRGMQSMCLLYVLGLQWFLAT